MIPPAAKNQIKEISPILEGWEILDAKIDRDPLKNFVTLLKTRLDDRFGAQPEKPPIIREGKGPSQLVEESIAKLIDTYRLEPPKQELMRVWPSLEEGSPARHSIIENIKRSLLGGEGPTRLAFVGVSLKFSLALITQALSELPKPGPTAISSPKDLTYRAGAHGRSIAYTSCA